MRLFSFSQELISLEVSARETWWASNKLVMQKDSAYFKVLVIIHQTLNLEYSVFCTQLVYNYLENKDKPSNSTEFTRQVARALAMAELLSHIYRHYLVVPREVERLQNEQKIYQALLDESSFAVEEKLNRTKSIAYYLPTTQGIRNKTAIFNLPRLFLGRLRLFLIRLSPVVPNWKNYHHFVQVIDKFAGPVFAHLAWAFYAPRLMANTLLLLKHSLAGPWMEEKEKKIDWFTRSVAQFERRWFELGNDSAWLMVGLFNCFLLTGMLAPIGIYLSIAFFAFDVAMVGLRSFIELHRINKLAIDDDNTSETFRNALEQHRKFEKKRLLLSFFNTAGILLAATIPVFAIATPLIPLLAACLMVTITVMSYILGKTLEKQRPMSNPSLFLSRHVLFSSANPPSETLDVNAKIDYLLP